MAVYVLLKKSVVLSSDDLFLILSNSKIHQKYQCVISTIQHSAFSTTCCLRRARRVALCWKEAWHSLPARPGNYKEQQPKSYIT